MLRAMVSVVGMEPATRVQILGETVFHMMQMHIYSYIYKKNFVDQMRLKKYFKMNRFTKEFVFRIFTLFFCFAYFPHLLVLSP